MAVRAESINLQQIEAQDEYLLATLQRAQKWAENIPWSDDGVTHTYELSARVNGKVASIVVEGIKGDFVVGIHRKNARRDAGIKNSFPGLYTANFHYADGALETISTMQQKGARVGCSDSVASNVVGYGVRYDVMSSPRAVMMSQSRVQLPEVDALANANRVLGIVEKSSFLNLVS